MQCGLNLTTKYLNNRLSEIMPGRGNREVNVRVLGKGFELLKANDGRFEINQLLFADDTALVADSERSCVDW